MLNLHVSLFFTFYLYSTRYLLGAIFIHKFSKTGNPNQYACAPEFSAYYSTIKYQELVKQFTKSFVLPMPELKDGADNTDNWDQFYPWGRELMLYLQSMSSNVNQGVVHDADASIKFSLVASRM